MFCRSGPQRGFGGVGRIIKAGGPRGSAGALPDALPTTCHRRLYHPRRHHRRYACPRRYRANRERTVLVPGSLAPRAHPASASMTNSATNRP